MENKDLWLNYKYNKDTEAKSKLIEHYANLVKIVAGKMSNSLSTQAEYDDLVSAGVFGLLDAVDKFDISKEIKFETYASFRIRGAIMDSLRVSDWVPRSVRTKAKELQQAISSLENTLGREPSNVEIAEFLGVSVEEVQNRLTETMSFNVYSLDEMITTYGDEVNLRNTSATPEEAYLKTELKDILKKALDCLSDRYKTVMTLYYFEDLTLKEIARILDITESRVSQIHSKGLLTLKNELKNQGLSLNF